MNEQYDYIIMLLFWKHTVLISIFIIYKEVLFFTAFNARNSSKNITSFVDMKLKINSNINSELH